MRLFPALLTYFLFLNPFDVHAEVVPQVSVLDAPVHINLVNGNRFRFTRISTEDGLSQTRVSQIVQDDQGFIWFGTQYGLNRYDGYSFKIFVHDPRQPDSMGGVFVTALFKDHNGALWVASTQSLDRYDSATETFEHITTLRDDSGPPPTIVHMSEDESGALWLSTGNGLYRLDLASRALSHFRAGEDDGSGLTSDDIRFSGEDREGNFWIGTNLGLDRFDRGTGKVTLHVPLADPVQIGFFEDRAGNFWILHASGDGLARLDTKTKTLIPYSFYERSPGPNELTGVMAMVEDEDGDLWVGSPGIGLLRFDPAALRAEHVVHASSDPGSIPEDKVIALFKDAEGNIWAGHHSIGPSHFNPRPPLFETFRHEEGNPNSLEIDFINAMLEDRRGRLWIGNDLGLTRIDRKTGIYSRFRGGLGQKPMIVTLAEDSSGTIWAGTYGGGLARLDEATGDFRVFRHDPDDPTSLANDQVHVVFVTRSGVLWAGTDDGLCRFDPENESFTTYKVDWKDHRAQVHISYGEDADGVLWLGTHYSGLNRFDPRTGTFKVFSADPSAPGSLRDNMVPAVHIDRTGAIWVGTQSGLDRLDASTGRFTFFDQNSGGTGKTVTRILEDAKGNLWISSNQGLTELDPKTGASKNYTAVDGLPGNDLTGWSTAFQSPSGEMFFGGFAGGIAFFPDRMAEPAYEPPIVLTGLEFPFLSAREASEQSGDMAIGFTHDLVLEHSANSIVLDFAALSYFNPPANRYRYKLAGLDDRWRESDSRHRSATFTTLPAGQYLFQVQGATARGDWSEPGAKLAITVLAPWWATWWFRSFVGLALAGLVFSIFRLRVAQLEIREAAFRKLAENAPDMVMRFDDNLQLRYANPAAEAFIGPAIRNPLLQSDGATEDIATCLPVRLATIRSAIESNSPISEEFEMHHAGGLVDLESRIVPERSDARQNRTILVITRDITRRNRAEAALRSSEAHLAHVGRVTTLGELTASIAHEVNQPLMAVVVNGEATLHWLQKTPPNLEKVTETVGRIIRDGLRATEIVARVAAFVRRAAPERSPLDVNGAIREVAEILEGELRAANVILSLNLSPLLPQIVGDRVQLQQVFLNLMKNAAEAMTDASVATRTLRVSSSCSGLDINVSVRDSGPGLMDELSRDIFKPFFSTKAHGMGMGLAISRTIIEAHGGKLWADSGRTGGSIFHCTLPVSHQAVSSAADGEAKG